ncbi:rhomboid family intramembrane serine protease [Streptomyces sp. ICBB 8177]|uniref:rhomboid family intramembrane serine protease n=1 Tax=Streptomyces sp. ICBB 8177 TaxID=563922 RepID=UPI000D674887|nr:rhomboid family intramembrane serine protease [Streptomyces sp. ICBB 8177]PWI41199.1 rhomboid family intramembrane serine protease [Streptomyces sp. ICBB 8177]
MEQAVCCYRHPERETGVRCSRCGRPICPECMVSASVGFHCPECVADTRRAQARVRPRTIAGGAVATNPRLVTMVLIGLNVAVFLAVRAYGDALVTDLGLIGKAYDPASGQVVGVADGQWYRLLTAVFLHQQVPHIALNMLSLWWIGPPVEAALGRLRYLAVYLLSGLGGSALSFLLAPSNELGLGASGAIFGLLGALFVLMRRVKADLRPIVILIVLNLVFTFTMSDIDWRAHIGGLVTGAVVGYGMVHAPRERRDVVQWATCVVMLAVIIGVVYAGMVRING